MQRLRSLKKLQSDHVVTAVSQPSHKSSSMLALKSILLAATLCMLNSQARAVEEVQQIELGEGWNLISVQVGTNWTMQQITDHLEPSTEGLHGTNVLQAVWGFDAATTNWSCYQPVFPQDFNSIQPGKGYWVEVSEICTLSLTNEPWDGQVKLYEGWNLVGLPGLQSGDNNPQAITSVFQKDFSAVQEIWTFDKTWSDKFVGYDTIAIPKREELTTIAPGLGYWINATESLTLRTDPKITLIGDADLPPLQEKETFADDERFKGDNPNDYDELDVRYVGDEDGVADLNGNGIIDDPWTQDTIRFDWGVTRKMITIYNEGTGLMNWSVEENNGDIPWLAITNASGVVSSEKAYSTLHIDTSGMEPGIYSNQSITVQAGDLTKEVHLILDVPEVEGDYYGYATTTRVNGKAISLGKVDLALNLFANTATNEATRGDFNAVINRDRSLLFPKDVFMSGVFYKGNDFTLTTSFLMPRGDRNAPPFDTFPNANEGDIDYNNNEKLDVVNPFPFDIRREVTLIGTRVHPDRLEGTYVETIANLLPDDETIYIEGDFVLNRDSYEATRRSIYNKTDDEVIMIGGSVPQPIIRTNSVADEVEIQNVTVRLDIDFPVPEDLTITLTPPQPSPVINLHQEGSTLLTQYDVTNTPDLKKLIGTTGKGDWLLTLSWVKDSTEKGWLHSWNLDVEGFAFYSATANIKEVNAGNNTNALAGASVVLTGSNVIKTDTSKANGDVTFHRLMQNEYQLTVSKVGYQTVTKSFPIDNANVGPVEIVLPKLSITEPYVVMGPSIGAGPLTTSLEALVPSEILAEEVGTIERVYWYFSDGTNLVNDTVSITRTFTKPGHYSMVVFIAGSKGGLFISGPAATVYSLEPDPSVYPVESAPTNFLTRCAFIGAGSGLDQYAQNKRDAAAFDIDRWPYIKESGRGFEPLEEDSDFFVQEELLGNNNGDNSYEENTDSGRYRIICTMGGYVMGEQPAQVGDFVLQTGRIED